MWLYRNQFGRSPYSYCERRTNLASGYTGTKGDHPTLIVNGELTWQVANSPKGDHPATIAKGELTRQVTTLEPREIMRELNREVATLQPRGIVRGGLN